MSRLLLLPGDGIGPEVIAEVRKVAAWMTAHDQDVQARHHLTLQAGGVGQGVEA